MIAIVGGTGPEGSGLALRWARAGESVIIGSRDGERARASAAQIAEKAGALASVEGADNADCGEDVRRCGTDGSLRRTGRTAQATEAIVSQGHGADRRDGAAGDRGGRASHAIARGVARLGGGAGAGGCRQECRRWLRHFIQLVVDCARGDDEVDCDVIVCSDDDRARQAASELATKIPGVRAVDGGKLENARIVEAMTALLITLNIRHKVHGAGWRVTGLGI